MENYRHSKSAKLAPTEAPFRIYGSPAQFRRDRAEARRVNSRPVITIELGDGDKKRSDQFAPGGFLTCEYAIDVPVAIKVNAFEASVIWRTVGKGDEDIGVHFFERKLTRSLPDGFFKQPQRLSTVLPATPLSYEGQIIKICWAVRIRLFLADNSQITHDQPFQLGGARICQTPVAESAEAADDQSDLKTQDSAPANKRAIN